MVSYRLYPVAVGQASALVITLIGVILLLSSLIPGLIQLAPIVQQLMLLVVVLIAGSSFVLMLKGK